MNKVNIGFKANYLSKNFFEIAGDKPFFYDSRGKFDLSNIEHKIRLYEDRVKGWFLDIGDSLISNNEHADFVVLMITFSYIEGVAQFRYGETSENNSQSIFSRKFKEIFNKGGQSLEHMDKIIKIIYESARCGLFHDGMSRGHFNITREIPTPIGYIPDINTVIINPIHFLSNVKKDFEEYILLLKDEKNQDLRNNFQKIWDILLEGEKEGQKPPISNEGSGDASKG